MSQLSENEKEKIRLEAYYRYEVAQEAEDILKSKNLLKSLWKFFNSKFGLWVLSSIFISGGAIVYEDYKEKRIDRKERQGQIEKLDLEISFRFANMLDYLNEFGRYRDELNPEEVIFEFKDLEIFLFEINKQPEMNDEYLYPELGNRKLIYLIIELNRQYERLGIESDELVNIINNLQNIRNKSKLEWSENITVGQMKEIIFSELILDRWRIGLLEPKFYRNR